MSRGRIRRALEQRPHDGTWERVREWSRTLEPFWLGAIRRFSEVAELPDQRRDDCLAAAEGAFERMDAWWYGRATPEDDTVEAGRAEIDRALGLIRVTAATDALAYLIQSPVAAHVAHALGSVLGLASGRFDRKHLPLVTAGLVYDWACARTLFPGVPAVLHRHLPEADRWDENGRLDVDRSHLAFGGPADLFGLRAEADAVYAEAERIWLGFDDPTPWSMPADIWTRVYDGTYRSMLLSGNASRTTSTDARRAR